MAKKKKPEPREWVVEVEMRSRETVIVLADTEEEALAKAADGEWVSGPDLIESEVQRAIRADLND